MKYIWPREFGLHNVFTSRPDTRETAQTLKDYTFREQEIARFEYVKTVGKSVEIQNLKKNAIPKRLRGRCFLLTRKLQQLHGRCSYTRLLHYYCPTPVCPSLALIYIHSSTVHNLIPFSSIRPRLKPARLSLSQAL